MRQLRWIAPLTFCCAMVATAARPPLRGAQRPGPIPMQDRGAAALPKSDARVALRALLEGQVEAWNRGDLEGFMAGYWKSDSTRFVTSRGVLRGWQAVLDRYRRSYPDRAAMGRLKFSDLEITPLGQDAALILGHWQLEREKDQPGGIFTLVARRFPEGWRIVHDHTSTIAAPAPAKP